VDPLGKTGARREQRRAIWDVTGRHAQHGAGDAEGRGFVRRGLQSPWRGGRRFADETDSQAQSGKHAKNCWKNEQAESPRNSHPQQPRRTA